MKANDTDTAVVNALEFSYRSPIGDAWVIEGSATALVARSKRKGILAGIATVLVVGGIALAIGLITGFLPNGGASESAWMEWTSLAFLMILGVVTAVGVGGNVAYGSVRRKAVIEIEPGVALTLTSSQRDAIVKDMVEDKEAGQMLVQEMGRIHYDQDLQRRAIERDLDDVERAFERERVEVKRAEARRAARELR